jgi:hypothetical protein
MWFDAGTRAGKRAHSGCRSATLILLFAEDHNHVSEPYLNVLEAIAEHPLSTRQALRDAGTPIDESALRQAIRRGLVEVHVTAVTAIGEEERFTLTRAGLLASGRDPAAASLLAELDQLERQERELSLFRKQLHARLDVSPDSALEAREREVSAERQELHRRIDELRRELGAAGYDVADPGPTEGDSEPAEDDP